VEQTERVIGGWLRRSPKPVGLHVLMGGVEAERWVLQLHQPAILVGTQDMLLSRALNRGYGAGRAPVADGARPVASRRIVDARRSPVDGRWLGDERAARSVPRRGSRARQRPFAARLFLVDERDAAAVVAQDRRSSDVQRSDTRHSVGTTKGRSIRGSQAAS